MLTKEELKALPQDELDALVHDFKSNEASDINNSGRETQIDYIEKDYLGQY